jgi:hypothetical protein
MTSREPSMGFSPKFAVTCDQAARDDFVGTTRESIPIAGSPREVNEHHSGDEAFWTMVYN